MTRIGDLVEDREGDRAVVREIPEPEYVVIEWQHVSGRTARVHESRLTNLSEIVRGLDAEHGIAAERVQLAAERVREAVAERDLHMLAAEDARRECERIWDEIEAMNFGVAKDMLRDLITRGLPNDHGGPVTSYPFLEQRRALREMRS